MKLKTVSLLGAISVLSPTLAFGLGLSIPDQDSFASARGNAFVATADNPSAIYYNPAGSTQLDGQNVRIGTYAILLNDHFEGGGGALNTHESVQATPQLYYTYSFQDVPISVGLGLYTPYGLSVSWPDTAPFAEYYGSLQYLTLNPVIAWKIIPNLSIAAGPTVNFGNLDIRRNAAAGFPVPAEEFRFRGDGVAPGFDAGVLWQPLDKWSLGASYHSETRINFSGDTSFPGLSTVGTSANVPFPQSIVGGVSFRPTPKWNFEFDTTWTDWHALKTVGLASTPVG